MRPAKANTKAKRLRKLFQLVVLGLAATEGLGQERLATGPRNVSRRQVLVSIPDRKLALIEDGRLVKVYRVAVGASESPSPVGKFKIVNRLTDPTYYQPGLVIPPGNANPLGPRWIGLNKRSFGIHGTHEPGSIGRAASHGCIRLGNREVEELFELVRVGDTVEIRGERDRETAEIFAEHASEAVVAQRGPSSSAGRQRIGGK